jgi:hypothetical protein
VIRRLLFRGPAPAADRAATEAEAQRAYREALDEARRERIAELERDLAAERAENIQLRAKLRVANHLAGAQEWMRAPARAARNLDVEITSVVPADVLRRAAAKGRHR